MMPTTTFVGRELELRRLQQFLDESNAGRGQTVFVAGEAGAGKSALVHEFVRRAQEADERVTRGCLFALSRSTGSAHRYR
jgi:predicted ATPase